MPIYPNFYQTLSACPIVELRGYAAACGLLSILHMTEFKYSEKAKALILTIFLLTSGKRL